MKESPPPQPPQEPPYKLLENITTLQTHLANIHHFKSKWSSISIKLTSIISTLSNFPSLTPPTTTAITTTLSSLNTTVTSAITLAITCSQLPPSPLPLGKLRTQSEVDSLSSLLDTHFHDLRVLHSGASDFITRLQIGTTQSKSSAIDLLIDSLDKGDENVVAAVSQGVVPVLVKLLDTTTSFEVKENVVSAIASVSSVESCKHVVVNEGLSLISHLIRVIESGTGFGKEKACVTLRELSVCKENARAIGSCGGISSLLEICHGGTPTSQGVAVRVLRNLAKFEEINENFIEENAVPVLIALSLSGTSVARENAVGCLANLVCNDDTFKVLVVREGGIESLKSYWDITTLGKSLEPAIELLRNLATYNPIGEVLIAQGFQSRLPPLLNYGVLSVRSLACSAVYELGFYPKARREMGECGCVAPLVRMLDGKAVEEKELASKALSKLLLCHFNRKVFRKEERGVVGMVQLLDTLTNKSLDKKWAVSSLTSLVQSKKCRKLMVGAGACVYLQQLVELDVDGARKLVECLGKGKIWGVFARP